MSRIHFIGGEKGGVGKSVMSRMLAQYHIDREIPFKVYDADLSHGAMMRYYADYSEAVDITKFESADQIAEQVMETGTTAIVDMAAQASKPLSRWVTETGLIELADELGLTLTFWHVMDDGADTLLLLQNMLDAYGERPDYVIVRNFGRAPISLTSMHPTQPPCAKHIGCKGNRFAWSASTHDAQNRPYQRKFLGSGAIIPERIRP